MLALALASSSRSQRVKSPTTVLTYLTCLAPSADIRWHPLRVPGPAVTVREMSPAAIAWAESFCARGLFFCTGGVGRGLIAGWRDAREIGGDAVMDWIRGRSSTAVALLAVLGLLAAGCTGGGVGGAASFFVTQPT